MAVGKKHQRETNDAGFKRMFKDKCWHSSESLKDVKVGDLLEVTNKSTGKTSTWRTSLRSVKLSAKAAEREWRKIPFGDEPHAKHVGFYPFVLRELIQEVKSS